VSLISVRSVAEPRYRLAAPLLVFALDAAHADDYQVRWRFAEQADSWAILAIADTDEGTDRIGSPFFRCRSKSGRVEVTAKPSDKLRRMISKLIIADQYPRVEFIPAVPGHSALLTVTFSEAAGWQYGFELPAIDDPFEKFKRTGVKEFKVEEATVHEEFKIGLDAVAKFQTFCSRPLKPKLN
jgi:hypothetical protein